MRLNKLIQCCLVALIFSFLIYKVGLSNLLHEFSDVSFEAIFYLAILSFVLIYISALKWKLFLEVLSTKVSVWRLVTLYIVGYFVNLILPSYVGGDAVRSWYVGKQVGQHEALAATILERFTGVVAMVAMSFLFMWFVAGVTWKIKLMVIIAVLGLIFGTVLILSPQFYSLLARFKVPEKFLKHANKVRDGLNFARRRHMLLVKALALSFLFHTFAVLNTMAAAYAVGWTNPPLWDLFVVLPLILLIGSLPLTPNGLGIQEGAFYYFLHGVGATPSQAIAVAVILRAKSYVLALCGGIAWFFVRKKGGQGLKENEAPISPLEI